MEHLVKVQAEQYALIQSRIEETRRARHDLRQHWSALKGCIDSKDQNALIDYVNNYGESLPSESVSVFCKNYAVNAVLNFYAEKTVQMNVAMDISFQMGEKMIILEPEFCVLLGNLLENALDSCADSDNDCSIRVSARQISASMVTLTVDNTSPLPPDMQGENLYSSKLEGFGIGTASVRLIAEKYNGDARFEWKEGVFYASVMLNP